MPEDIRVLIIDDQQTVCKQLGDYLGQEFSVTAQTTVNGGMVAFRNSAEKPDPRLRFAVAIVDLRFENLEEGYASEELKANAGSRLIAEARRDPFLEVVVITAHGGERQAGEALVRGIFRYVVKSINERIERSWLEEVAEAVREAVAIRERWLALFDDLLAVQSHVNSFEAAAQDAASILRLSVAVEDALKNFHHLLKSKGHHPDHQ